MTTKLIAMLFAAALLAACGSAATRVIDNQGDGDFGDTSGASSDADGHR